MRFEVITDKGAVVMGTEFASCIPDNADLSAMAKAGYKFRLDGKIVNIKKINEFIAKCKLQI